MALAGQVHSWFAMVEVHSSLVMGVVHSSLVMGVVHSWMQSRNVHHCRALSTLEWVGRTADAAVLERVKLRCTQRGNVHPRRTADTWHAASAAVLVPDAVVSFDGALRSGTVERAGSPSWPTGWTAVGVVLDAVVAAVDIAAAAAAVQVTVAAGVAAMQVSVAAAMGVTAAAAMGLTAAAARELTVAAAMWLTAAAAAAAAVVHRDHRLGACPSACLSACLVHGYHLQPPLRRCLYRQRLAHVGKRPS